MRLRIKWALGLGLLWSLGLREGAALSLRLREMDDDASAIGLSFGGVDAREGDYHSAHQYLEIAHTDSRFRKVYLYTDNTGAFGRSQEGLINLSTTSISPIPLLWNSFPGRPAFLDGGNAAFWKTMMEKGLPEFEDPDARETRARVLPESDGISRVGLGFMTGSGTSGGAFVARVVVEETSDVADIAGPRVSPPLLSDLILTGIPMGFNASAEDDGSVVSSTFYFRLDGEDSFQSRAASVTTDTKDPFRYTVSAELLPADVAPGGMEYYFAVRDGFDNETRTPVARVKLVPADGAVSRTVTTAGGTVRVPVGDPRLPGFVAEFPPHSLNQEATVEVSLLSPNTAPPHNGFPLQRAFELKPEGVRFNFPVTLTMPYPDADQDGTVDGTALPEKDMRVFWFNGREWRYVGGQVDTEANQVRTQVSHFSVYGLAPLAGGLTPALVRPTSNTFSPNGDGVNDDLQFGISGEFEVEIFDVRGKRVRRLSNNNTWDGRGDDGTFVETGTYVYRVNGQGMTVTGTLAVVR